MFISLVVIISSIWVYIDAKKIGAKKGLFNGGFLDLNPGGWAFCCLFFWLISFPLYLIKRGDIKLAVQKSAQPTLKNPNTPVGNDSLEQLEKLADLKAKGILTEEEFNKKKQQILAG